MWSGIPLIAVSVIRKAKFPFNFAKLYCLFRVGMRTDNSLRDYVKMDRNCLQVNWLDTYNLYNKRSAILRSVSKGNAPNPQAGYCFSNVNAAIIIWTKFRVRRVINRLEVRILYMMNILKTHLKVLATFCILGAA